VGDGSSMGVADMGVAGPASLRGRPRPRLGMRTCVTTRGGWVLEVSGVKVVGFLLILGFSALGSARVVRG
jgi:hypothetical protein